ncbi:MAG: hypothetical protein AAGC57_18650 [Pseudomonadota bacterium]
MSNPDPNSRVVDDTAIPMPRQMALIDDVFRFSFDAAVEVERRVGRGADLILELEEVAGFIQSSDLSPQEADTIVRLLMDEAEVVAFSQAARSSVIRF